MEQIACEFFNTYCRFPSFPMKNQDSLQSVPKFRHVLKSLGFFYSLLKLDKKNFDGGESRLEFAYILITFVVIQIPALGNSTSKYNSANKRWNLRHN